ncbi:FkbM family methyltransferase [Marinobacter pelagius]|uniref:Methyltransferase, FkbM family n=1 Tax=Marinobacter pelagius TaxID=379482 RepID=A0A1I4T060_9GAMM|nr:FkbM family methyltransferase [Marinobacter pelagius]SFM70049.1 methyltransferase, FkbM family [Marinobacter pelagius]
MRNFFTWVVMRTWPFPFGHVRLLYSLKPTELDRNIATTRLRGFPLWITYDPNSEIGRYLFYRGSFEEQILRKITEVTRPGDRVLDVGANIGVHSLVFSTLVQEEGQVVAIEPQSKVRKRLMHNIDSNQVSNICVLGCALGSEECTATIYDVARNNDGAATLKPDDPSKHDKFEHVEVKTFDFVRKTTGLDYFDIIKIDVEGAELEVINGLSEIFRTRPPRCLFVECVDSHLIRFGTSSEELISRLENLGYSLKAKHKGRWKSIEQVDRKNCDIYAELMIKHA